ncbi:hypothetical protein ACFOOP_06020 [Marinicaulis aureus]|uniref:Uncharacterized protein n=1 Tax=Hyphococcus aureus TaxID=2666033 RepID=A0ABW1KVQ2_9PROT
MTKLSKAVTFALFSLFFGGEALGNDEDRCDFLYVQEIAFTSLEAEDNVILTLTGEDCASAVAQLSIFAEGFQKVFSHEVALPALTAVDASGIDNREAHKIAEQIWEMLGPHSTRDLEPWKAPQDIYDLFDEIPALPREEYEAVRQLGKPYICVQSYYEGADCYWFNPQNETQLLLKLSD